MKGFMDEGVRKVWTEADSVLADVQGKGFTRVMPDADMTIQNIVSSDLKPAGTSPRTGRLPRSCYFAYR